MKRLVVSFPKSGRTWLRYGLHLAGHPNVPFTHDGCEYNDSGKPPLSFDPTRRIAAYGTYDRIVYIERDPRDTIVSLFHQITGRFSDIFGYTGDISSFIRDPYFGIQNLIRFQAMWHGLSATLPVMIASYEEMSNDYTAVFKRITTYLDLPVSDDVLARIGGCTSFSAMRDVEQARRFDRPWLQPRMGAPKVRRGKVGGYLDELSPADVAYVENAIARVADCRDGL